MPGRRPRWWEARCSWAELAARMLAGYHGRAGGVVTWVRRSVAGSMLAALRLEGAEGLPGENPLWLCQVGGGGAYGHVSFLKASPWFLFFLRVAPGETSIP